MKKLAFALVVVGAMGVPTSVLAHQGPPVDVFTDTVAISETIPFAGPCGGGPGQVTIDVRDTFHITQFDDGHYAVVGNQRGTFSFDPDDDAEPSSTGHYVTRFRDTGVENGGGFTSVFNVVGRFDDGALLRFQVREQFVFANGELRVDRVSVAC
jgi:hypothetical protein